MAKKKPARPSTGTSPGRAVPSSGDRRKVVEQMRREQQRADRRRSLLLVGVAALVGAIIIGLAVWQTLKAERAADTPLATLGTPLDEAGCEDVQTEPATGSGDHLTEGQPIEYEQAPPSFGPHWPTTPDATEMTTRFFTADDRPPVERLVHSLEHGWTVLWYDEEAAADADVEELQAIARTFAGSTDREDKLVVAPWTSDDGEALPEGTPFALTHWSLGGADAEEAEQVGVTQFCAAPSGEAVEQFLEDYPYDDSPEGGNPGIF